MKKLLAFAAVAAFAFTTQAAQFAWGSGTVYLPKGGTGDDKGDFSSNVAGSGVAAAYYFIVDAAAYGSFDAETAFKDRFDVNSATGAITLKSTVDTSDATKYYTRTTTGVGAANWTKQQVNAGQTVYALAIYTYTGADKQGWYIANRAYATLADGDLNPTGTYSNIASSVGAWTAVPEPTTVALLALGLAAVGLKRKVA